jgi:hypothetical protein
VAQVDFETPVEAALATWRDVAGVTVQVESVEVRGGRAEVILGLGVPGHRDFVYCVQQDGRWVEAVSSNGPTIGWDDPDQIHWS